jgi:UDP-glucose 4-epimerase
MLAIVTGAAGFIGSHLVERLLANGATVIGVDAFTNDYSRIQKRQNLESVIHHPRFSLVETTILYADWASLLPTATHLFHLAGQTGVRSSWGRDFTAHVENNIVSTQHLLEACAKYNPRIRMVFASTSSAYGDTTIIPAAEYVIPQPISPYGVSKVAAEYLCHAYHVAYQLPISIVRYFTVYGPRQRPDMAFSLFFRAALQGRPVIQYGDGQQTRDFTYVDDAVSGTLLAAEHGQIDHVYNIGGGHNVTVKHVFGIIEKLLGAPLQYDIRETQHGDALHTWADTRRAAIDCHYAPLTRLELGLEKQYNWIRQSMTRNGELT